MTIFLGVIPTATLTALYLLLAGARLLCTVLIPANYEKVPAQFKQSAKIVIFFIESECLKYLMVVNKIYSK